MHKCCLGYLQVAEKKKTKTPVELNYGILWKQCSSSIQTRKSEEGLSKQSFKSFIGPQHTWKLQWKAVFLIIHSPHAWHASNSSDIVWSKTICISTQTIENKLSTVEHHTRNIITVYFVSKHIARHEPCRAWPKRQLTLNWDQAIETITFIIIMINFA